MATAEDLMTVLKAMEENNRKLSEELIKVTKEKGSQTRRWYDAERFKNIKEFNGKEEH